MEIRDCRAALAECVEAEGFRQPPPLHTVRTMRMTPFGHPLLCSTQTPANPHPRSPTPRRLVETLKSNLLRHLQSFPHDQLDNAAQALACLSPEDAASRAALEARLHQLKLGQSG